MKYLRISSLGGLYHELYQPSENGLDTFEITIKNNTLDATNLFWSLILDIDNIRQIIPMIKPNSPKQIAVLGNVELFLSQVKLAQKNICYPEIGPRVFFSYIETLSIVCDLYSEYVFYPHRLTIQNGFELEDSSAKKMYADLFKSNQNPYLQFISKYIMPKVEDISPDILFVEGKPSYYTMAVSCLTKEKFPGVHVSLTRHSSEYYSMNKLENHLINNFYLFKMIDSIILEYYEETESRLISTLKDGGELSQISNLIYQNEGTILQTPYLSQNRNYTPDIQTSNLTRRLINVHLQPYIMCYWNKCTFCGINKKYHFRNEAQNDTYLNVSLNKLLETMDKNTKYLWFIDEAIHPSKLKCIAKFFITNNVDICWQARCRIEKELLEDELIALLAESGLKELRLGLESASLEVLKVMNKFENNFSLEIVESICSKYSSAGISIHFPIIIGMPGETSHDRKATHDFLLYLVQKYPLVTFNVNIFNLDIKSHIYNNAEAYGIKNIEYPCELNDFLGNTLRWQKTDEGTLSRERDQYMREILYPWMPISSYTKPYLYYRLCETIRNTLIWKSKNYFVEVKDNINLQRELSISDTLTYSFDSKRNIYVIYNWYTHHYMIGNKYIIYIFELFQTPQKGTTVIEYLCNKNPDIYTSDDLKILLNKLYQQEYLVKI